VLLTLTAMSAFNSNSFLVLIFYEMGYVLPAFVGYFVFSYAIKDKKCFIPVILAYVLFVPLCLALERCFVASSFDERFWKVVAIRCAVSYILLAIALIAVLLGFGRGGIKNCVLFCVLSAVVLLVLSLCQGLMTDIVNDILPDMEGTELAVLMVCNLIVIWYSFAVGRSIDFKSSANVKGLSLDFALLKLMIWIVAVYAFCAVSLKTLFGDNILKPDATRYYILHIVIASFVATALSAAVPALLKKLPAKKA
jgi:hypothetical protein